MAKKSESEEIKGFSLEESFDKIDEIMEKLQDDKVPLEESFDLYKEGMDMLKHCREVIDDVEKKVIMLSEQDINNEDEE